MRDQTAFAVRDTEKVAENPVYGDAPAVSLPALLADFRRFLWLFVAVFVVTFAVVVTVIMMQTPKYTAASTIMIDPRVVNASPDQTVLSGMPVDTTTIDTEVEVIQSPAVALRVAKALNLDRDPEFNPALRTTKFFGLIKSHRQPVNTSQAAKQAADEAIGYGLLRGLNAKRKGTTRVITIAYTSKSPIKAARIANEWANQYLLQQLDVKSGATSGANTVIASKLTELRDQAQAAQTAVQQYKIDNNILITTNDNTIGQQQVSTLDQQLASVKVDEAAADARLRVAKAQLASGSSGDDVGEALESNVIRDLRMKRTEVSQSLADLSVRYGPQHPSIQKAKQQLAEIDSQISAEIKRIISNLDAQAQIQHQRAASLQASVGRARGQLIGNTKASVGLNELQNEADAANTLYKAYLDRYKQTSSQQGTDTSDSRIVSAAVPPGGPSSPKKPLALALALISALGAGAGTVFFRRSMETTITSGDEIETAFGHPYLGSIADLGSSVENPTRVSPMQYVVDKPLSAFSEGFRNIRAALMFSRFGEAVKVIAITSSLPGEGKTTTSVCLARTMARAGQSVVLVDCDLRRRALNKVHGKKVENGLMELLAGGVRLADVLIKDDKSSVRILPLSDTTDAAEDAFGSTVMDDLLAALKANFDVVILDTAPLLPVSDTRILAKKADVVALLVRWRKTPKRAVEGSLRYLEESGARIGGVALTQVNLKAMAKYGYGDDSFYYGAYKKYYTQ